MAVTNQSRAPAASPPGSEVLRRLCEPYGQSGRMWRREYRLPPPGFEPLIVQPVASRNYDYAIPARCTPLVYFYAMWK